MHQEFNEISENKKVSTEQFVLALWKQMKSKMISAPAVLPEDLWLYGRTRGWLEEIDQLHCNDPIERRHAARILHEFLRIECGEKDERDWKKAEKLEDLYHCRVCAKHIAQVFLKGLMEAGTEKRFGLLHPVTERELQKILTVLERFPSAETRYSPASTACISAKKV